MPSPFPGMDPYLEGSLWSSVHSALSVEIARQLSPKLRPCYIALTEKRFVIDLFDVDEDVSVHATAETVLFPDVAVADVGSRRGKSAGVALEPPLQLTTVMPESVP